MALNYMFPVALRMLGVINRSLSGSGWTNVKIIISNDTLLIMVLVLQFIGSARAIPPG